VFTEYRDACFLPGDIPCLISSQVVRNTYFQMYLSLSYTFQSTLYNFSTIIECNEGVIRGSVRWFISGEIRLLLLISCNYLSLLLHFH